MALGARPVAIVGLIVGSAIRLTAGGIVLGLLGGIVAARVATKLLFDIPVLDPLSFGGAVAFILAIALLASYLPAHRAVKVDPTVALRYE